MPEILGGFPRHLTAQLIEEKEGAGSRRELLAGWILGLGLASLALSLPQERLVGEAFVGGHEGSAFWTPWHRANQFLANLLGLRGEQVRFISSALAYGACLPACLGLGRRLGCPFGLALVASSIALLAPTAWIAGTTPGMASVSLLLQLLLMRELWRAGGPRSLRCLAAWGIILGVQESMFLLWPALAVACMHSQEVPAQRRKVAATWILGGSAVAALIAAISFSHWEPVPLPTQLTIGASRWNFDGGAWMRLAAFLPGLGLALPGLASLWLIKRAEAELSPPRWLFAWTVLPALALLTNSSLTWDASYLWLLPIALLGLFDLFARWEGGFAIPLAAGALLAQLALLCGLQSFVTGTDPLREWRHLAREFLQPSDTVITGHAQHAYLTSHRWGLKSVVLRAADPDRPSSEVVEGVYVNKLGFSNLRPKTQDATAWAAEGLEAHGLGFRVILDRPFPPSSEGIAGEIDRILTTLVEFQTLGSAAQQ